MLINVETTKDFDKVVQDVQEASKAKGYGVMSVYEVHNILQSKGFPIDYRCTIVEICNPRVASQMLSTDAKLSTVVPCKISVVEKDGKVILSTLAFTYVFSQYGVQGLEELAKSVEEDIKAIMEEAAK